VSGSAAGGAGKDARKAAQEATDLASVDSGSGPPPASSGGSGDPGTAGPGGEAPGSAAGSPSPSSGSASGSGSKGSGTTTASAPSAKVTETVNSTVNKVDETVTGSTLESSGVTETTEGVVNGAVGPESPVGHVADETVTAVGGPLHGGP
nr:hypothetical protein [Solirubrobacterales bacterium]